MGYILETIQVILCGRTREDLNHDTTTTGSLTIPLHMESEYGDDWIGLPLSADSGDLVELLVAMHMLFFLHADMGNLK